MRRALGLFLQITGLILLPSVLLWALMGKITAKTELAMLAAGAALFYLGVLASKGKA